MLVLLRAGIGTTNTTINIGKLMPDQTTQNEPSAKTDSRSLSKYIPLLAMFAVATLLFFVVNAQFSASGRPTMDMLIGLALLNLGVYVWIRVKSGFAQRLQIKLIALLVASQALLFATVQMEGIYGNGRPVFSWRWKSLPADTFAKQNDSLDSVGTSIELPSVAHWSQFRGPQRDGVSPTQLADWNDRPPKELWRQPIGAGWSSFVVAGEFCFTMEQRSDTECTTCYETATGKQIWIHRDAERFSEITGGEGPRSTPTFAAGFLYTLGATGILNCLDATNGDVLWSNDILKEHDALNCYYGMCTSPLVVDDLVIVNPGGKSASLVAYNRLNGNLVWRDGNSEASYASPHLMTICGVQQVLNFNADGMTSHDLKTGRVLWDIPWISNPSERNNVCQPIQLSPNQVFLSSGYGRGSALFEFSISDNGFQRTTVWQTKKLRSKFASAVFDGRHIFGLDEGILVCLDAASGDRVWKQGRYNHGQILLAGDHIIVQSEDGYVAQVAANATQFRELARVQALNQRTWTHPVVIDDLLLTRNDREVVCYRLFK